MSNPNVRFKLGKKAVRHDPRTLQFKSYLTPTLPPPPVSIDWTGKVTDWQMLGNDTVGDCTCAGAGHLEMAWSSYAAPTEAPPTTEQILAAYSAITGYTPSNPNSDTGADCLTVLNYWRGPKIAGHGIKSYTQVSPNNINEVKTAIALFGGVYIGVQLPDNAMDQFNAGQPWSDTSDQNIEGGHCIVLVGYDENYFTAITWGTKQLISPAWFTAYTDEAYAVISPQWVEAGGVNTPTGFNLTQLEADLKAL
jgi:hypothetical protein